MVKKVKAITFTTGSKRTGNNTRGVKVRKGQKVRVIQIYIGKNESKVTYKVKVGRKTGWINKRSYKDKYSGSPILK